MTTMQTEPTAQTQVNPTAQSGATDPSIVVVEARLLPEEYSLLVQAAEEAGLSPNDFVRQADHG